MSKTARRHCSISGVLCSTLIFAASRPISFYIGAELWGRLLFLFSGMALCCVMKGRVISMHITRCGYLVTEDSFWNVTPSIKGSGWLPRNKTPACSLSSIPDHYTRPPLNWSNTCRHWLWPNKLQQINSSLSFFVVFVGQWGKRSRFSVLTAKVEQLIKEDNRILTRFYLQYLCSA